MKHLSIVVLALAGAMAASCGDDDVIEDAPHHQHQHGSETPEYVVVTATVTYAGNRTYALDTDDETDKSLNTFAEGDRMAVSYQNWVGDYVKAVSARLKADDISERGKKATFTFILVRPMEDCAIKYVYPAAMAGDDGKPDLSKLDIQDGTLETMSTKLDLAEADGTMSDLTLPKLNLSSTLSIVACNLKDREALTDISASVTEMTVTIGTRSYTVSREAAEGPVYLAIEPVSDQHVDVIATDGTQYYTESLQDKTYEAGDVCQQNLLMRENNRVVNLAALTDDCTLQNGDMAIGKLGANVKLSIANGASVTLSNVSINADGAWKDSEWAGISCLGSTTITLRGANTVVGFHPYYPGIWVPADKTLSIRGTGSLNVKCNLDAYGSGYAPGIGGMRETDCGYIVILDGIINATGGLGNPGIGSGERGGHCNIIEIKGGTVNATGGGSSAGIGSGYEGFCSGIVISGGTVNARGGASGIGSGERAHGDSYCNYISIKGGTVTATPGGSSAAIGAGYNGRCGNITIAGGTITAHGGYKSAGIGSGATFVYGPSSCGDITIYGGNLTITKGDNSPCSIGNGADGSTCGTVTVHGTVYPSGISESPYILP